LINFFHRLTVCDGGQKDAMSILYNDMAPEDRSLERSDEDKIAAQANETVQQIIQETLTSEALLKDLIPGEDTISQMSHQTIYLKNRLSQQIGLNHSLTFDRHTGVLYDHLIDGNTEEMVQTFFNHCTADKLFAKFKGNMEKMVQKSFGAVDYFLSLHMKSPPKDQESWERYIEFDDYSMPLRLTDFGALAILEATGYLTQGKIDAREASPFVMERLRQQA